MVASEINETNEMASSKSMFVNLTISSSNANLSPVIDLKRVNAFAISNRLNQQVYHQLIHLQVMVQLQHLH